MTPLTKGKHTVAEIDGVRCTVVESDISEERMLFLKNLLEFNRFEVKTQQAVAENGELNYTIGVTDPIFNPVIAVYERSLRTAEGHHVSAAYYCQFTKVCDPRYWMIRKNKY